MSSSSRRARPRALALLLLLGLALAPALVAAPAQAEGSFCSGQGVNLVIDYGKLGGGVEQSCAKSGAGQTAAKLFEDAGHRLTPVGEFPAAVCKIDDKPADAGCAKMPPADAYWGLYVKKEHGWDYAPKGATDLKTTDGDYVGFAWQSSKTSTPPSVKPVAAAHTAATMKATDEPADQDGSGLSWWIPALVAVVLLAAAVGVAVTRRRRV